MSTLYENIKFHCDRLGISGAKLCADAKVSKSTLTSLKNGRTKKINTENLSKMASVLGVTVDELLGSEQKENPTVKNGEDVDPVVRKLFWHVETATDAERQMMLEMIEVIKRGTK